MQIADAQEYVPVTTALGMWDYRGRNGPKKLPVAFQYP
jgi:hypothetical protein